MNYSLTKEEVIINSWSKVQLYSRLHWIAVLIFAATTYAAFFSRGALIAGYVLFFLVTALPKIYKMVIFFLITTAITAIFPPLGIILTIIFFIIRIKYIMENWKALFAGVLVYSYPFILAYWIMGSSYFYSAGAPFVISLCAGVAFHFLLVWLYRNKFSTKNALGAMGAAPLFFIMLVLPFIVKEISEVVEFSDFNDFETSFHSNDYDPGTHSVTGHWRQTPSGDYTYVDPHIRTNPDGIESNNFSYRK